MDIHKMVSKLVIAGSVFGLTCTYAAHGDDVSDFHQRLLTIDTHIDIPWNYATPTVNPLLPGRLQGNIPGMKAGGLDAAFFIVYVDQSYRNAWEYEAVKNAALGKFKAIHRMVEQSNGQVGLAYTAADLKKIAAANKTVALIGIENGFAIGKDISLLKTYYDLGARYMTLVHNGHNDIGDSAQPSARFGDTEEEHGGLSAYGRDVVKEMNRLGIIVDISHVSKQTMLDATKLSASPVIASHSCARELIDHPRNVDDEQLEALKANGGVIQISAVDDFLNNESAGKWGPLEEVRTDMGIVNEYLELVIPEPVYQEFTNRVKAEVDAKFPRATVKHLVDHLDYVIQKIGIDHVGLSSDFDGGAGILGWDKASETENVTRELVNRGYSEADIQKIWSGNVLRVMEANEKNAQALAQ